MSSVTWKKYTFLLFSFIGFVGLLALGFWQLQRLEWKENLLKQLRQSDLKNPIPLAMVNPKNLFQRVKVKGRLGNRAFYVIGRMHHKQLGYHVIVPLYLERGQVLFVNLGWSKEKREVSSKEVQIVGRVRPQERTWFSARHIPEKNEWGFVDFKTFGETLGVRSLPFYVDSVEDVGFGFIAPEIPTLPNKHREYAITWFLMAVCWLVFSGIFYRRSWLRG